MINIIMGEGLNDGNKVMTLLFYFCYGVYLHYYLSVFNILDHVCTRNTGQCHVTHRTSPLLAEPPKDQDLGHIARLTKDLPKHFFTKLGICFAYER